MGHALSGASAIVVGAGIAGLSAAIALRHAGYGVTVLEAASSIEPLGAALSLWPNAMEALDLLGVGADIRAGAARISHLAVLDQEGRRIIGPLQVKESPRTGAWACLPTRALLQSVLRRGFGDTGLILGTTVTAIDQNAHGVVVTCADGAQHRADLAIVANGIWSAIAGAIIGTAARHSGYGGMLAMSDAVSDSGPAGQACECWGSGERFGLFDIGDDRRYWFFIRNESPSMPLAALTHPEILALAANWPAEIGAAIRATPAERLIAFSAHAKPPPSRLGIGRIICVGDAAHAMEPNLGQGACQGIEDAVALGEAAKVRPPGHILPLFERMRLRRIHAFVTRSAEGGRAVHDRSMIRRWLTRTMLTGVPDSISGGMIAGLHALPDYAAIR